MSPGVSSLPQVSEDPSPEVVGTWRPESLKRNLEILLEAGIPWGGPARAREGVGVRGSFRATWTHLGSAETTWGGQAGGRQLRPIRTLHLETLAADGLGRQLVEVGVGRDGARSTLRSGSPGGHRHPSSRSSRTLGALLFSVQSELPRSMCKKVLD